MGRNSCCVKQKLRKGLWSPEEDEKLYNYITRFGVGCWSSVPKLAGLQRCGKSCRLRWINYLRPDLKRGMFSQQEEDLIINLHESLGNRWAQIAAQLPGRTDNEIKNFWNSSLKKKLLKQGVDPNTHKPINEIKDERENEERESMNLHHHHHHHHHQAMLLPTSNTSTHQMYNLSNGGKMARVENLSNKQTYDPLFLSELQPNVDFLSHPNPFTSMPNLTGFDLAETSRVGINEGRESSGLLSFGNSMMMMNGNNGGGGGGGGGGGFCWEEESKQLDLVFQFQFSGIQIEEKSNNSNDFDTYNMSSVFDHHHRHRM